MNSSTKKAGNSKRPQARTDNFLEALRDIGGGSFDSLKGEANAIPQEFFNQLFGLEKPKQKASGDLVPGQSLEISQALEEQKAENQVLRARLSQEQSLRVQEQALTQQRGQEIKMELNALTHEVGQLASTTQGLAKETQIAAMQGSANPGIYHVNFFEKLREYIRSFRKKIENATLWMQSANQRAAKKKTFWGQVGKSGAKRLLSAEDYLQRSAG